MSGDQPCDFCSSPVSSNNFRLSQPTTGVCGPPALVHSVWLASEAKFRWCVGKQVLINVNLPVVTENCVRAGADAAMGDPRFGMLDASLTQMMREARRLLPMTPGPIVPVTRPVFIRRG